jgi:NADPH-dependent F420 reductase
MTKNIAVIGGTGKLGSALARRWAKAGLTVIIGSRLAETAREAAEKLGFGLTGMTNAEAAAAAAIVVVTVPFAAQEATLAEIARHVAGKVVVDTTVPLMPPKVMTVQLPQDGSAAQRAKRLLGEGAILVSSFHSVAAHKLITDMDIDCDALVFSDDKAARAEVVALANLAGLRGLQGGPLANSAAAEALTSVLIFMNKTYHVDGAGIRITGALAEPAT